MVGAEGRDVGLVGEVDAAVGGGTKWSTNFPIFLFPTMIVGRGVKGGQDNILIYVVCDL